MFRSVAEAILEYVPKQAPSSGANSGDWHQLKAVPNAT